MRTSGMPAASWKAVRTLAEVTEVMSEAKRMAKGKDMG